MAILDVRMPKINGFELASKIRELDDKVKITFMSAFDVLDEYLKTTAPTLYEENQT